MRIGGVSIMGSYHEKNQDMFLAETLDSSALIVVSDGVGSCSFSEIGSRCACLAVRNTVNYFGGVPSSDDDMSSFYAHTHNEWIRLTKDLLPDGAEINDCCATVLFCFYSQDKVIASRLGDGLVGVKTKSGTVVLIDDKTQHMINETDSLNESFFPEEWEFKRIDDSFLGAICCSDGASPFVYEEDECRDYTSELVDAYSQNTTEEIERDMSDWLPELGGCDDKTIAFIFS